MKRIEFIFVLRTVLVFGIFAGSLFGGNAIVNNSESRLDYPSESTAGTINRTHSKALSLQETYNRIAKKNMPSVVSLHVHQTVIEKQNPFGFFGNDDFFRHF